MRNHENPAQVEGNSDVRNQAETSASNNPHLSSDPPFIPFRGENHEL